MDIVKLMIDKGAKLNVRNQWGMTELHTAIWRGNIHVAAYLLDQGSDPLIKTNEGCKGRQTGWENTRWTSVLEKRDGR